MKKHILILYILIAISFAIIGSASAIIEVNVTDRGSSFITWAWDTGASVTDASIDGWFFPGFDPDSGSFTLSGLPSNETHNFCVYSAGDKGCITGTTLQDNSIYAGVAGFVMTWIYILLIAIMFLLAVKIHWLFYWFGSGTALYALYREILSNPPTTSGINSFFFWVYVGLLIMGFLLWMLTRHRRR